MIKWASSCLHLGKTGLISAGISLLLAIWSIPIRAESLPWETFISLALKADDPKMLGKAEALFQQIHASGGEPDPNNLRLVWGLMRLAEFHVRQGNLAKGHAQQTQAMQLLEKKQGSSNLILLIAPLNGLASIWLAQGNIPQARQSLEHALDIVEKTHGPSHLLNVRILEQLAKIHLLQENPKKALQLQQRIADIQEYALMPDTHGHAIVLARLAQHYQQAGQNELAEPLFQQAKEILMKSSGPYHGARVDVLTSLATLTEKKVPQTPRNTGKVIEYLKSALAISENMNGSDHPDLVPILENLAAIYQKMGKPDQSRPLVVRTIALVEKHYGPDHEKTAEAILALAENLRMENQPKPALPLYNRAMVIFRHQQTPTTMITTNSSVKSTNVVVPHQKNIGLAHTLIGLAKTLRMQGKIIVAELNHRDALEILVKTLGPKHPDCVAARLYQTELVAEIEEKTQTTRPSSIDFLQQVRMMQERLLAIGDDPGPMDGRPGKKTGLALNMLQRRFGLPPSIKITKKVLDEVLPYLPPPVPNPDPLPNPSRQTKRP